MTSSSNSNSYCLFFIYILKHNLIARPDPYRRQPGSKPAYISSHLFGADPFGGPAICGHVAASYDAFVIRVTQKYFCSSMFISHAPAPCDILPHAGRKLGKPAGNIHYVGMENKPAISDDIMENIRKNTQAEFAAVSCQGENMHLILELPLQTSLQN